MPPAPTDLMAGDLKRLEESSLRVAARMDGLEAGIRDLREGFAGFRGRVDAYLGFMKWLGVFVAGILVAVVAGTGRVVWDASAVNTEMKHQGVQFDAMSTEVKQQGTRLDAMSTEVKQQGTRLENVEKRLDGVEKRLGGVEGQLNGIGKQLEILIRRAEPKAGA